MQKRAGRTAQRVSSRKGVAEKDGNSTAHWQSKALRHALPLAVIVALILLAYGNSLQAPFLFDNNEIILQDTRVHSVTADHIHRLSPIDDALIFCQAAQRVIGHYVQRGLDAEAAASNRIARDLGCNTGR